MGQTRFIQNALNSGELSPRLRVRDDYERYTNGVQTALNVLTLPTGGLRTQYGQQWIAQTKDQAQAYLWPFEFSTLQAYVIEAGNQYFRFFKDGGRLYDLSGSVSNAADNGSGLIRITTSVAHGLSTNDYVYLTNVGGTVEANGEWKITVLSTTTFDLQGSTFTHAWTSGGSWTRPYAITTPYAVADLPAVKLAQSADTLYLAHPKYAPRKLTRTGHTNWTLSTISFLDGPYLDANTTTTTLTPSAATGSITLTASATTGINGGAGFQTTDVGRIVRLKEGTTWGYATITARTSTTVVSATVVNTLTNINAKSVWRLGAWSETTGYPGALTIFEQRLCYAASTAEPQRIWMSTTGSYEDFTPSATSGTVADSDAVTYQVGSNRVNTILWLVGGRDLTIGTVGEEFSLTGGNAAVSASNPPLVRSATTEGSANLAPVRIGSRTVFVQRSTREVRELYYSFNVDDYVTEELSLLVDHYFRAPLYIQCMAYQNKPNRTVWIVRSDGALLALCKYVSEKVQGWSQCYTASAVGSYAWATAIPSVDRLDDQAWFVTKRTLRGVTGYHIEMQRQDMNTHCGLTYTGAATTSVTGLWHLEGQTVKVIGNGAVYDDQTVTNGTVSLQYGASVGPAATTIEVGLAISPSPAIVTLQPAYKDQNGSIRNKFKHWASVDVELEDTLGLTLNGNTQIQYRTPADPMDTVEPSYTGSKHLANLGWSRTGALTFQQTLPLAATVLGYNGELETGD